MNELPWRMAHPHTVYGHIATALTPKTPHAAHALGNVTLQDHQLDAATRVTRAIDLYGGALLADAVGLGKTYVALAVARVYQHAHIIVPATLLPLWRQAILDTKSEHTTLHSLQTLSRRPLVPCNRAGCLVVIDEAHHFRTRNTIRYRNAAAYTANRDVLLLSATPIHNRPQDLQNLLGLFLGTRVDVMDERSLAGCIVRRTKFDTLASSRSIPTVRVHAPLQLAENPRVLETLLRLPSPLPTKDGAAAGALIRLGLLRAWCSSDAALSDTLRRRQLRGEAMLHSLASGHHPTRRELQSWILGNDSIQLGFAELLVANAAHDTSTLINTLSRHLEALHQLLHLHTQSAQTDPERAAILRGLLSPESQPCSSLPDTTAPCNSPIVAFSHFASTVRALHRALRDIAGVASLTSRGGHIASGSISRQELIAAFTPVANGRPPPPPHQRVRLLLTTDMLSEGVNLQDAGTVVHLDLPWTDAARAQRVGRLVRMGSRHKVVNVFTFAPPPGIESTLQIVAALEKKSRVTSVVVGTDLKSVGALASGGSAPEIATQLHTVMQMWTRLAHSEAERERLGPGATGAPQSLSVACVDATENGWIAVVAVEGQPRVLSGVGSTISEDSAALLHAVRRIVDINPGGAGDALRVPLALADIDRWNADRMLLDATGPSVRAMSAAHQNALRKITECVAKIAAPNRARFAGIAADAAHTVMASRGAGAERVLVEWCATAGEVEPLLWLSAVSGLVGSVPPRSEQLPNTTGTPPIRVQALLLLLSANIRA